MLLAFKLNSRLFSVRKHEKEKEESGETDAMRSNCLDTCQGRSTAVSAELAMWPCCCLGQILRVAFALRVAALSL